MHGLKGFTLAILAVKIIPMSKYVPENNFRSTSILEHYISRVQEDPTIKDLLRSLQNICAGAF